MKGRVSVVLLSRNRCSYTAQALATLTKTDGEIEYIVVDSGSSDGSLELLREWAGQNLSSRLLIGNERDHGAAASRNLGASQASGEYLLFLDNDIVVNDSQWLTRMLSEIKRVEKETGLHIGAASPLLLFPGADRTVQCAGGGITENGHFGLIDRGLTESKVHHISRFQAWAPTAALLVRRHAFLEVRGFDEAFDPVSLCEDLDFCCHLRSRETAILFVGSSKLMHYEGTTFNHLGYDKLRYWKRHAKVIKNRWQSVFRKGPFATAEQIAWRPLVKSYGDPDSPSVRLATDAESQQDDLTFFSSRSSLASDVPIQRIAVIGCGQAALRGALPGLSSPGSPEAGKTAPFLSFNGAEGVRIVGVADVNTEAAAVAAARFGALRAECDGLALLELVPMEGVVVCTPPHMHAFFARAAMERNVGVLVEKPAACSSVELCELIDTRRAHQDATCMVNLVWAYHPAIQVLRQTVASGVFGSVETVDVVFEHSGPETWSPLATWYRQAGRSSVIRDLGPHVLVCIERTLDTQIEGVEPDAATDERSRAKVLLKGVSCFVDVAWNAPAPRFEIAIRGSIAEASVNLIPWGRTSKSGFEVTKRGTKELIERRVVATNALHGGPYRDFVECLVTGRKSMVDLSYVSNALGRVLSWSDEIDRSSAVERAP